MVLNVFKVFDVGKEHIEVHDNLFVDYLQLYVGKLFVWMQVWITAF